MTICIACNKKILSPEELKAVYEFGDEDTYCLCHLNIREDIMYDITKAEVEKSLKDPNSFRALLKRYKENYTGMDCFGKAEWIIYGKYAISSNGIIGKVQEFKNAKLELANVISIETFKEVFEDKVYITFSNAVIPDENDICKICNQPFKTVKSLLDNDNTYDYDLNVWNFYHIKCKSINSRIMELDFFQNVFKEAGYIAAFKEIQNRYWRNDPTPWFEVDTPDISFIIGWRKRVISIEWDSKFNLSHLFEKEDVTKFHNGIHAWNKDKAIEYLKKIKEELNK